MPHVLVAHFDRRDAAQAAIEALAAAGFDRQSIRVVQTREDTTRLARAAAAVESREAQAGSDVAPVATEAGIVPATAEAHVVPFPVDAGVMPLTPAAGIAGGTATFPGPMEPPPDDEGVFGHVRSFFAEIFGPAHVMARQDVERYSAHVRAGGALVRVRVEGQAQQERALAALRSAQADRIEELPAAPSR